METIGAHLKNRRRGSGLEICPETINDFRYLDAIAASRVCSCRQVLEACET